MIEYYFYTFNYLSILLIYLLYLSSLIPSKIKIPYNYISRKINYCRNEIIIVIILLQ